MGLDTGDGALTAPGSRVGEALASELAATALALARRFAADGPDPVAVLRSVVEPGDVLLAVATAGDPAVADAMARAPAWGAETVWLGAGATRPAGADHVLWFDAGEPARDASLILAYHVLWELTHVCFEHPGIVGAGAGAGAGSEGEVCVTCSDEGRVGEVVGPGAGGATVVRSGGGVEAVDTTLVGTVAAGDLVLIHAGVAISRIGSDR
jgi:hypothetical protein